MGNNEWESYVFGVAIIFPFILFSFSFKYFIYFCLLTSILIGGFAFFGKNRPCSPENVATFFKNFRIGGHRGAPHAFPENGMAGFLQAKKDGADLIEFDVALTKDGAAVLLHDDDLDRTTDMTGPIREKTKKQLSSANIAAKFKRNVDGELEPIKKEGIPSLDDVVKWSVSNNMTMLFDVKDSDAELVKIIADLFREFNLYDKAIVCSFFPSVVYRIKRGDQSILTGLTWRQKFFSHHDIENLRPRYTGVKQIVYEIVDFVHVVLLKTVTPWFLGADLLLTNNLDISQGFINQQRSWGRHVAVWTVNDIAEMHWMLETLKIPILTDYPHYTKKADLLRQLHKSGYHSN